MPHLAIIDMMMLGTRTGGAHDAPIRSGALLPDFRFQVDEDLADARYLGLKLLLRPDGELMGIQDGQIGVGKIVHNRVIAVVESFSSIH